MRINRTTERFIRQICVATVLFLCCQPSGQGKGLNNQTQSGDKQLESGQPLERQIAGGKSHNYQIRVRAGQFIRVLVEPKGIDLSVSLTMPDGPQVLPIDVRSGALESLSQRVEAGADCRLSVRALGAGTLNGSYLLRLEERAPTEADSQRIAAERLMIESKPLVAQGSTARQATEKLEQALLLWRGLSDQYYEARTLYFMGRLIPA